MNRQSRLITAAMAVFGGIGGCSGDGVQGGSEYEYFEETPNLQDHPVPTFEAFRESSRVREVAGELYMVEMDLPIHSSDQLRAYYDAVVGGQRPKLAAGLVSPWDPACNQYPPPSSCVLSTLQNNQQLGIKYCVSDEFAAYPNQLGGTIHDALVGGMALATYAWQQGGNIWFQYVPEEDDNCSENDTPEGVYVKVMPWAASHSCWGCCSTEDTCAQGGLTWSTNAPQGLSAEVAADTLSHELGHALGFTHENFRPDWAASCSADQNVAPLTSTVDYDSIMLVDGLKTDPEDPRCAGNVPPWWPPPPWWCSCEAIDEENSTLSDGDRFGASVAYGIPAALHATLLL